MLFSVDPSNGIAIYDQIVRQFKFLIASGTVTPGELIPSVRELSKQIAVNPNTVSRAYRELQADEIVATVRGTGLEVTKAAPKKCRADRITLLRERLRSVLVETQQSQLATSEIRELVEDELNRVLKDSS